MNSAIYLPFFSEFFFFMIKINKSNYLTIIGRKRILGKKFIGKKYPLFQGGRKYGTQIILHEKLLTKK